MWIINKLETLKNPSHLITVNRLNIQNQTKLSCSFPILKAKICVGGWGWEGERAESETSDKNEGSSGSGAYRLRVPIRLNKQL